MIFSSLTFLKEKASSNERKREVVEERKEIRARKRERKTSPLPFD